MVKENKKKIFRIILSCLLVGYLSKFIHWPTIIHSFKNIDILLYFYSTLIALAVSLLLGAKYYLLIKETSVSQSFLSLVKINFISRFYALFLPSAGGPNIARWYKLTLNKKGRSFALASIVFERLTVILLSLIWGLIPLFIYSENLEITRLRTGILPFIICLILITIMGIVYFISPVVQTFLRSLLKTFLPFLQRFQNVTLFLNHFILINTRGSFYIYFFSLSILSYLCYIGRVVYLCQAFSLPLGFIEIAWISSLVLLLQMIPVSIAGIGVREGGYAYLFMVFGLSPEKGVLIGILLFSQMILFATIGGILELLEK